MGASTRLGAVGPGLGSPLRHRPPAQLWPVSCSEPWSERTHDWEQHMYFAKVMAFRHRRAYKLNSSSNLLRRKVQPLSLGGRDFIRSAHPKTCSVEHSGCGDVTQRVWCRERVWAVQVTSRVCRGAFPNLYEAEMARELHERVMWAASPPIRGPRSPFPMRHTAGRIWGKAVIACLFPSGLPGRFCLYLKLTRSNRTGGALGIFIPHIHSAVLLFYFCFAVHIFFSAGCLRCRVEVRRVGTASRGGKEPTPVPQTILSP